MCMCFLGAPSVHSCFTLSISASYLVFVLADISNPDLFVCGCWTCICLDIVHFHEESASHSKVLHGRLSTKTVNR